MSKYQPAYNKAKIKSQREMVPVIKDQIDDLKDQIRSSTDIDLKKGLQSRLKALEIKMKSFRRGDPVKEEIQVDEESAGTVSTTSIGSPTMSTSDGGTEPAIYGSSHIFADKVGPMVSRKGDVGPQCKKKKRKKTQKEFVEFYFDEEI